MEDGKIISRCFMSAHSFGLIPPWFFLHINYFQCGGFSSAIIDKMEVTENFGKCWVTLDELLT